MSIHESHSALALLTLVFDTCK